MLSNFTDNYNKDKGSNIEKINEIIQREIDELINLFTQMKINLDVDIATGKQLDKIGANVQEFRNTPNDDLYRQLIKTKIIANRSHGDIETINEVGRTLTGSGWQGVEETWHNSDYENEPAGLVINIRNQDRQVPFEAIERVRAGGVGIRWVLDFKPEDNSNIWIGNAMLTGEETTIFPYNLMFIETEFKAYIGAGQATGNENITIYPRRR